MYNPRHATPNPRPGWAAHTRLDLTQPVRRLHDCTDPSLLITPTDPWPTADAIPVHWPPN